jgi:hypothetical protein
MSGARQRRLSAIAATVALTISATATAWASPCIDDCPMVVEMSPCCAERAREAAITNAGQDAVEAPAPDCCESGSLVATDPAIESQAVPVPQLAEAPAPVTTISTDRPAAAPTAMIAGPRGPPPGPAVAVHIPSTRLLR